MAKTPKTSGERVKDLVTQLEAMNDREARGRHAFQVIAEDIRELQEKDAELVEYSEELEAASGDLALAVLGSSPAPAAT